MERRLVRIRISKAYLSEILKAQHLRPGEHVTSNLPDDAEVLYVANDATYLNEFSVVVASDKFDALKPGEEIPALDVTFTRRTDEAKT